MFWSFRLGIMHFSFLFALHKSLSGVGVSIGVLGVTCKHLGSKREWKVLFERVENRSGQWERPTTPAPDETKPARPLAPGFGTRFEPTPRRQLLRVGATKTERGLQPARKNEGTKLTSGATSRSEVKHPLWKQSDLTYPRAFFFFWWKIYVLFGPFKLLTEPIRF